jgi:hypothetical protein
LDLLTASDYRWFWGTSKTYTSTRLALGGVLAIIAGAFDLAEGLFFLIGGITFFHGDFGAGITFCGSSMTLFGALSVVGGGLAISRRNWRLAFVCSFLGVVGVGFLVGAVVGGIAMVIIAVSREEFHSTGSNSSTSSSGKGKVV